METIDNYNYNDEIVSELVDAILEFAKRQELVKQAILDLGITLEELYNEGPLSWRNKNISQGGVWLRSPEWQYFLHGGGCRLSNPTTGEVIDWNSKNKFVINIDPHIFVEHLNWRLKRENSLPHIKSELNNKKELEAFLPLIFHIINDPDYFR